MKNNGIFLLAGVLVLVVLYKWQYNQDVMKDRHAGKDTALVQKSNPAFVLDASFPVFYEQFKHKLKNKDRESLQPYVSFPLMIKKEPKAEVVRIIPDTVFFNSLLDEYLDKDVVCPCTNRIREKAEILTSCKQEFISLDDNRIRCGDLVFIRKDTSWLLTELYMY